MFTFQFACQFKDAGLIYNLGFYEKNNQYTSNVKGPDTIGDFCNFLLR